MNKPILFKELKEQVKPRKPRVTQFPGGVSQSLYVAGKDPHIRVAERKIIEEPTRHESIQKYQFDLEVTHRAIGVHAFPPAMQSRRVERKRMLLTERDYAKAITGFLPEHLEMRPVPHALDEALRLKKHRIPRGKDVHLPTTVFGSDDRYTFNDTAFPWCTTGRIAHAGGWASGTMVGPRHVLTVSHTMDWINPPNPYVAGWVMFTPSYFDGSAPFGTAAGSYVYWQDQVNPSGGIDSTEEQYDYVVIVLDRRIGDVTGWMGSKSYTDSWDNGTYWSHIGYPGDLTVNGTRPSFQGSISLNGSDTESDAHEAMLHTADVWPGQSGGPMFGWWADEPWPRVVGVQSWQSSSSNAASGGASMVDLIIRARNDFP